MSGGRIRSLSEEYKVLVELRPPPNPKTVKPNAGVTDVL